MSMNLFSNPYCYYKCLYQYKKCYRQRGMFRRCCRVNNIQAHENRFGEWHFKSDIIAERYLFN